MQLLRAVILLVIAGVFAPSGICLAADRVLYELNSYGVQYVVIKLSGSTHAITAVTPGEDKQLVRITGSNIQFAGLPVGSETPLIKALRQVKRGSFTDLLVSLAVPTEVTTSSGKDSMQVTLKALAPIPGHTNQSSEVVPPGIKITKAGETQTSEAHGLTLVLPAQSAGVTKVAQGLQWMATASDLTWQWLTGEAVNTTSPSKQSSEDLTPLVNELSAELSRLRSELQARDQELAQLKQAQAATQ